MPTDVAAASRMRPSLVDETSPPTIDRQRQPVEPPWGVEPQTYALRGTPSSTPRCSASTRAHGAPFKIFDGTVSATTVPATNRATMKIEWAALTS